VVAAGLGVLALVALAAASAWPDDSPLVPRRGGHPEGDEDWAWLYLGAAAGAFVAYVAGLVLIARGARVLPVAALALAIQLAPLGAPLLLSTDAWTYWLYGRIATVHDANPYADEPAEFPQDAAFPHVGSDWHEATSVYGPAFTLASEPVARAAGESEDAAAWIYKSLAALAVCAAAALAARLATRRSFAWAFVGWNPLLALHFAGGGHNDAWMAALVVGALALGVAGRTQLAGAAWACAIAVKWVPLVLLPLVVLEARARGRRLGYRGFALAAAAIGAAATWRYGLDWLGALGPLAGQAGEGTSFALPRRLDSLGVPYELAVGLLVVAFAVAYVILARGALRGRARLGLTAGLLLLATPYLVAWYVVWSVPLAAAEDDRPAQMLALALSAYLLSQAVPL
jgi:alpha-1,6-mannosyltransferase